MTRPQYIRIALALGLTAREALDMAPGLLFDLLELENQSRGKKEDESWQ